MKKKGLHNDSNRKKRRQKCRQRCGHCQQFLSKSQFHEHRRLYFNSSLNQWKTIEDASKSSVPEDVLGSSSSESEGDHIRNVKYSKNSPVFMVKILGFNSVRETSDKKLSLLGNCFWIFTRNMFSIKLKCSMDDFKLKYIIK